MRGARGHIERPGVDEQSTALLGQNLGILGKAEQGKAQVHDNRRKFHMSAYALYEMKFHVFKTHTGYHSRYRCQSCHTVTRSL